MKKSKGITVIELFLIITTLVLIISIVYSQILNAKIRGQVAIVEKTFEKVKTQIELNRIDLGGRFSYSNINSNTLTECTKNTSALKQSAVDLAKIMNSKDGHISCSLKSDAWAVAFDISYINDDDREYTESTACFDSRGYDIIGVNMPGARRWNEAIDIKTSQCIPPYGN